MASVKSFIKDNKALIIAGVILLIVCVSLYFYDYSKNKKTYEATGETDTPYVKREYKANEYTNIDVELIDVLNDYYAYFIKKKYTLPEEAYEMLTDSSKKEFANKEEYKEYCKKTKTINSLTNSIKEYRINEDDRNAYDIIDTEGKKYTIYEHAVWDIKVSDNSKK